MRTRALAGVTAAILVSACAGSTVRHTVQAGPARADVVHQAWIDPPWQYPDDLPAVPTTPPPTAAQAPPAADPRPTPTTPPVTATRPAAAAAPTTAGRTPASPKRPAPTVVTPAAGGGTWAQLAICEESGRNDPVHGYYGFLTSTWRTANGEDPNKSTDTAGQHSMAEQQAVALRLNGGRIPYAPAGCVAAGYHGW